MKIHTQANVRFGSFRADICITVEAKTYWEAKGLWSTLTADAACWQFHNLTQLFHAFIALSLFYTYPQRLFAENGL